MYSFLVFEIMENIGTPVCFYNPGKFPSLPVMLTIISTDRKLDKMFNGDTVKNTNLAGF